MLPIFSNTMKLLKQTFPHLISVIHVASNQLVEDLIAAAIHKWPVPVILIPGGSTNLKYEAFSVSLIVPHDFHLNRNIFELIASEESEHVVSRSSKWFSTSHTDVLILVSLALETKIYTTNNVNK